MSKFIIYINAEHLWLSSSMLSYMFPCRPDVRDSWKLCLVKSKRRNDTLKSWKVPLEATFGSYDTQTRVHSITRTLLLRSLLQRLTSSSFLLSYQMESYPWIMILNCLDELQFGWLKLLPFMLRFLSPIMLFSNYLKWNSSYCTRGQ